MMVKKKPKQETVNKHKQELVYFEQLANGDEDYPRAEIGYKDKKAKRIHIQRKVKCL